MIKPVANPQAAGNVQHGNQVFQKGIRDPVDVLMAHLWWNRGPAADYYFANGYREARKRAGVPVGDSLRYVGSFLTPEDRAFVREKYLSRKEIPCPY